MGIRMRVLLSLALAALLAVPASASRLFTAASTDSLNYGATTQTDAHSTLSVCAWVWPTDTTTGGKIISHGDQSTTPFIEWNLRTSATGKASMETGNGSVVGTTTVSISTWHSICGIMNGTNVQIYLDGAADATAVAVTFPLTHTVNNTMIGNSPVFANNAFAGRIAEVAVWPSATIGITGVQRYNARAPAWRIEPGTIKFYVPVVGQSPEPDWLERQGTALGTVTGTSITPHPAINR